MHDSAFRRILRGQGKVRYPLAGRMHDEFLHLPDKTIQRVDTIPLPRHDMPRRPGLVWQQQVRFWRCERRVAPDQMLMRRVQWMLIGCPNKLAAVEAAERCYI